MSFLEHIAKTRVALGFAVRVRGIPYIFASFDEPSSSTWKQIGSEYYTWHKSILPGTIGPIVRGVDPWTGRPKNGDLQLRFRATSIIRALLDPVLASSERAQINGDVGEADTTFPVDDPGPLFPGTGFVHIGTECCELDDYDTGWFTVVARGAYGSRAQAYWGSQDQIRELGIDGPSACSRPLRLDGRIVDLWAVPLAVLDGVRTPLAGTSLEGPDCQLIDRGVLATWTLAPGSGVATLTMRSLASLLDAPVMARYPYATLGHGLSNVVQVDVDCNVVRIAVYTDGEIGLVKSGVLRRDDGTGTSEDVPVGLYTETTLAQYLEWTILELLGSPAGLAIQCGIFHDFLRVAFSYSSAFSTMLSIALLNSEDSLWPELGASSDKEIKGQVTKTEGVSAYTVVHEFTLDNPPPQFRLTASGLRRIYFRDRGALAFLRPSALGFEDASATDAPAVVRIGEELVEFGAFAASTRPDDRSSLPLCYYLTATKRGVLGTIAEEFVVERDDEPEEMRQVLALPMEAGRAFLYLACSGLNSAHEFEKGWRGCGAGIDPNLFDAYACEAIDDWRTVVVTETTPLLDVVAKLMPALQAAILCGTRISLRRIDNVAASDSSTAVAIGVSDCANVHPAYDAGTDRIVNVVKVTGIGYNPGKEEGVERTVSHGTSGGTYGYKDAVEVDVSACPPESAFDVGMSAAVALFEKFSDIYATIGLELRNALIAWFTEPLDVVSITHPSLPDGAGGEGAVSLPALVWECRRTYAADGELQSRGSLTCVAFDVVSELLRVRLSPSLRGTVVAGAVVTVEPDEYSGPTEADVEHFEEGDVCRVSQPGTTTSARLEIVSISGNDITFDSAVGFAAPVVIEFATRPSLAARQKLFAIMSDGTGLLDTDPAHKWS